MSAQKLLRALAAPLPPNLRRTIALRAGFETSDIHHERKIAQRREAFLHEVIPTGGIGAELGVYKGVFTGSLLKVTQPSQLHIIDPWYKIGHEWHWGFGDRSTTNALIKILRHYEKELISGQLVLHIDDDIKVMESFPENYFDWVYIDTTHQYEHTLRELHEAARIVKGNGVITGDDWRDDPNHRHAGVKRAVEEFCSGSDYEIVYSSNNDLQWAIRLAERA